MKKCEHFRDLILTDYIDGELDKNCTESLESHLLDCSNCQAFLKEAKINAAGPWKQALEQPVPAELWDTIKQGIEHKHQAAGPLEGIIDQIKGLLAWPKLVPVFSSLVLMVLAGSVTLNTIQVQQFKDNEQGEYLVSMLSPTEVSALSDNNDGATPIEHYFL